MSLAPGSRLGAYEVLAAIGAGGMGEVYRARDTRLGRDVALKVLPDLFVADPERLARFEREAKTLASLNHPHIAQVYGIEEGGTSVPPALVMELVDGDDLAQRIADGPLPLDEALSIAKQIAEALAAAHEQGIIHRDLKPANIKVRPDGTVKVLDFGLAKALESPASSTLTRGLSPVSPATSPTITSPAPMTIGGMILGTAAYMAPEQAKGKPLDRRADLWAFGCVLYEMLSGKRAFGGDDVTDTLAFVITKEPDWSALPESTPFAVRKLLRRCLAKNPRERLADADDARLEIGDAISGDGESPRVDNAVGRTSRARIVLPWAIAATAVIVAAAVVLMSPARRGTVSPPVSRMSVEIGSDAALVNRGLGAAAVLSRDGTSLAFIGQKTGASTIYLRRLEQLAASALPNTEDAASPFFSPDGQWIGFFAGGKLKKISISGGAPLTLADAPNPRGATWADDDGIFFVPDRAGVGVLRVSAAGGAPVAVTQLSGEEQTHRWPEVLPDAKAVIYTAHHTPAGEFDDANIVVQPLPTGEAKVIHRGGQHARYVNSGHIVFIYRNTLFSVPFDHDRLEVTGQAVPVLEGVSGNTGSGAAQFALSSTGTLLYSPGASTSGRSLLWLDSAGTRTVMRSEPTNYQSLAVSPDGSRLVLQVLDRGQSDLWVYDIKRGGFSRVTSDPAIDSRPMWTPDGESLVFTSNRQKSSPDLYWQRADGTGPASRLLESPNIETAHSWHPSGRFLALVESWEGGGSNGIGSAVAGNADILILPVEQPSKGQWRAGKPSKFLGSTFVEAAPAFSPDGRWLAYHSNESGRMQVYVTAFPAAGGKSMISIDGGMLPIWSTRGPELFYRNDRGIMVASYKATTTTFTADKPRLWAEVQFQRVGPGQRDYDLLPDGRFVIPGTAQVGLERADSVVFVLNFAEELRRIAPPRR